MAAYVMANDLKKGDQIILRDGTPATIMDNTKGMSRRVRVPAFWGPGFDIGTEYIFRFSCRADGTPIKMSPEQQKRARLIQLSGF